MIFVFIIVSHSLHIQNVHLFIAVTAWKRQNCCTLIFKSQGQHTCIPCKGTLFTCKQNMTESVNGQTFFCTLNDCNETRINNFIPKHTLAHKLKAAYTYTETRVHILPTQDTKNSFLANINICLCVPHWAQIYLTGYKSHVSCYQTVPLTSDK